MGYNINGLFGLNNTKINYNSAFAGGYVAIYDTTSGSWFNAFIPFECSTDYLSGTLFLDLDQNDNIYISNEFHNANFNDTLVFENDTLGHIIDAFVFVAKYDINGNHLWHFLDEKNIYTATIQGLVIANNNHPFVLTGMSYNEPFYKFSSVSISAKGIVNHSSNNIIMNEYDENGNLLNSDVYSSKEQLFSRMGSYGIYGVLSTSNCGDIYYANSFYDITINSTAFSNTNSQIITTKYTTDKQCEKRNCVPVTGPLLIPVTTKDICFGGTATISWDSYNIKNINIFHTLNNGKKTDTLAKNYAATNLEFLYNNPPIGMNSVIIQDASNNTIADTNNFTIYPTPTITISNDTFICNGQSITLKASASGSGNSYLWKPDNLLNSSITVIPPTSKATVYSVNVTTQYGCKNSDSVKVTSNPIPNNSFNFCSLKDSSLLFSVNISPNFEYRWYDNDTLMKGIVFDSIYVKKNGNYSLLTINKTTNCSSQTSNTHVSIDFSTDLGTNNTPLGITNTPPESNKIVVVYDNNVITIKNLGNNTMQFESIHLSDMSGQIVYMVGKLTLSNGGSEQINASTLSSGIYILTLNSEEKTAYQKIPIIH